MPEHNSPEVRSFVDRLLTVISLLLVVLTVIASEFSEQERYWDQRRIATESFILDHHREVDSAERYCDDHLRTDSRCLQYKVFDTIAQHQHMGSRLFFGIMCAMFMVVGFLIPVGYKSLAMRWWLRLLPLGAVLVLVVVVGIRYGVLDSMELISAQ